MIENNSEQNTKRRKRRSARRRIAMVSTHGYVASTPPLGAPDTGGQVVYILELSKKLVSLGYKVDIWTRRFEDQPGIERINDDLRIIRVPCGGHEFIPKEYLSRYLGEWVERALRFIKSKKLKYIFINSHYWDGGWAAQQLADALGVSHVHTPHSIGSWKKQQMEEDYPENKHTFEEKYNFTERINNETRLFRESNLIIATSPAQLDLIKEDYDIPHSKIRVIPPGYDDNRFFPVSESTRAIIRDDLGYKGKKVIASIGRLARNKGFDLLIDAFSIVKEREENVHLALPVGTEAEDEKEQTMLNELKEKISSLGLEDSVQIMPSLPDDEMADFYRAADVFALPSRYEPIGMTAIEAMACGTPTVMTTNGGLYRTMSYGVNSLYADSFDKQDFGITLLKPLQFLSLKKRLSLEGAHHVRSLFTWTGIAQQILRAIEGRVSQTTQLDV